MIRLSSSLTLGFALFFPVFWFVFFGSFTAFILATDAEDLPITNTGVFKLGLLVCFLFFGFLIYKGFAKLKRVELEDDHLFVTNYFKTISFPIEHVARIHQQALPGIILVTLEFDYKTFFGNRIRFISDAQKIQLLKDRL